MEHMAALEGRKESSMPIRAGIFFEMFPFCLLFEKDMIIKNMGGALRNCIPQMVGKKVSLCKLCAGNNFKNFKNSKFLKI